MIYHRHRYNNKLLLHRTTIHYHFSILLPRVTSPCRKLDTEPLGSLGTLRVVGSVVVCVVVCMREQHSQRHIHESFQNCGKNPTQEKRKKVTLRHVSFSPLGTSKVRQTTATQPPPTPVLARPAAKSWPAHQELTRRHHFTLSQVIQCGLAGGESQRFPADALDGHAGSRGHHR